MWPPLSRLPESLLLLLLSRGGGGGGELERDEPPSLPRLGRSALLLPRSREPLSREPASREREPLSRDPLSRDPVDSPSRGTIRSITRRGTSLPRAEVSFEPLAGGGVPADG